MSQSLDDTLHALSHSVRRQILTDLTQGQRRVTEIAADYNFSLNAISKHLKVLESAELIRREQQGRDHFIHLNLEPLDEVKSLLDFFNQFWMDRFAKIDQLLEEADDSPESNDGFNLEND